MTSLRVSMLAALTSGIADNRVKNNWKLGAVILPPEAGFSPHKLKVRYVL